MVKTPTPPVSFVHDRHSPDIFADAMAGLFFFNGNLRITFESVRVDHATSPGPVDRVVIGRLVMPIAAAEYMARAVLDFVEKQKAPRPPEQSGPTIQ